MSLFDAFRFSGKRALVVGGATGIGAAAARIMVDAGADVVVMDYVDVDVPGISAIKLNLAEVASIEAALERCDGPVDVVLACAGVADGTPGLAQINFIGHRHLIEGLRDRGWLPPGSAVGFISSAAGLGWESQFETLNQFLDTPDFDSAVEWVAVHDRATYMFTKQAVCAYVAREAMTFLKSGIRINAICPGPTDTPLAQANKDVWLAFGADYRREVGVEAATALEQAYPLIFLCSDAASVINGVTLVSDSGYLSAGITAAFPAAAPLAKMLLAR